jgi:hypothetical protein
MIEKKMFLLGSDAIGEWVLFSSRPEAVEDQEVLEGTFTGEYFRPEFGSTLEEGWTGWFYDPEACLYMKITASRSSGQWVDDIDSE